MDGAGPRWVYFVLSWPPIGEFGEERVPVFSAAARGSSGCLESKRNWNFVTRPLGVSSTCMSHFGASSAQETKTCTGRGLDAGAPLLIRLLLWRF